MADQPNMTNLLTFNNIKTLQATIQNCNLQDYLFKSGMQQKPQAFNPFKKQLASCPFNSNHTFEKQKLLFHISRCKDKQKRMPYLAKCKHNPLHYVDKDKIALHEQFCVDRKTNQESIKKAQLDYRTAQRQHYSFGQDRQRSRDDSHERRRRSSSRQNSRQNRSRSRDRKCDDVKKEKIEKIEQVRKCQREETDEHTLSDCEECQNILKRFKDKIKQNPRISKLIQKYEKVAGYNIL